MERETGGERDRGRERQRERQTDTAAAGERKEAGDGRLEREHWEEVRESEGENKRQGVGETEGDRDRHACCWGRQRVGWGQRGSWRR